MMPGCFARAASRAWTGACPSLLKAIDDPRVLFQPEKARLRIAGLREGRDRADLDRPEAEPQQRVRDFAALVEAGRHAERRRKAKAEGLDREAWIMRPRGRQRQNSERRDRRAMGLLGLHGEEQRPGDEIDEPRHDSSAPKSWAPSGASGSGSTRSASSARSAR
jgi:hypothetical protein